ncbi:MAG: hypothetical protein QF848_15320 [Planctomycetota bacterium]|nr:hypothetical protein [Planctomycetota bacterium]
MQKWTEQWLTFIGPVRVIGASCAVERGVATGATHIGPGVNAMLVKLPSGIKWVHPRHVWPILEESHHGNR